MAHDYFAAEAIVEAMQHDHLCIWLEMIDAVKPALRPGCRVLDFGCSSGELVRILCRGVPGLLDPVNPSLAVGLEQESMREVLDTATAGPPATCRCCFRTPHSRPFPVSST